MNWMMKNENDAASPIWILKYIYTVSTPLLDGPFISLALSLPQQLINKIGKI